MITYPNVKVNLGLSVLRKRSDGYHDLETLFVPCLDIRDTLEIIPGDDFSRTSASLFERYSGDPEVPVPENCATLGNIRGGDPLLAMGGVLRSRTISRAMFPRKGGI